MAKYSLVLFDADGTLFDYDMAEGAALKKVFEHHQFEYCDDIRNRYREINSHMWKEFSLKADIAGFNSIYWGDSSNSFRY